MPTDSRPVIPNEKVLATHFEQCRPKLRAMIASRLDPRARGRRDADDLLHEVFLKARGALDRYAQSGMTPYAWFYRLAMDLIRDDHDFQHAECRNVCKERALPDGSTAGLVPQLAGSGTSPSQRAAKEELQALMHARLHAVLPQLDPDDREILLKHNFDGLTLAELAQVLAIPPATARQRYARARLKLRDHWIRLYGEPEAQS